jgi:hypothetical protein
VLPVATTVYAQALLSSVDCSSVQVSSDRGYFMDRRIGKDRRNGIATELRFTVWTINKDTPDVRIAAFTDRNHAVDYADSLTANRIPCVVRPA